MYIGSWPTLEIEGNMEGTSVTPLQTVCVTPLQTVCVTPLRTVCVTPLQTVCVTPLQTVCATPLQTVCATPLQTVCATPLQIVCVTPLQTVCATPFANFDHVVLPPFIFKERWLSISTNVPQLSHPESFLETPSKKGCLSSNKSATEFPLGSS